MKAILTRYIFREMVGPTVLGFLFYTSIILMQKLFDLAGMIIRRSLSAAVVGKLLLLSLPHIVVLTVPMSLLFGILIAVGRMSADSEIIAMRALGISTRTIYRPVFLFSVAVFLLNLYLINVVMPKGNAEYQNLWTELLTSSVEKDIRPRVFYDEYENLVIYVNDIDPRTGHWKGVFVSDTRSSESADKATTPTEVINRAAAHRDESAAGALSSTGSGQRIIIAQSGTLSVVKSLKQVWMNLTDAEVHFWDPRKPANYDYNTNAAQRILVADKSTADVTTNTISRSLREMDLRQLLRQAEITRRGDQLTYNLARVEIHKKFAIPFACIVFGILGLPLGLTNRRGGKSSGFSLSIGIIVFYYLMINNGERLAASGKVSPFVGMWGANLILLAVGIYLLARANRDAGSRRSEGGLLRRLIAALMGRIAQRRTGSVTASVDDSPSLLNRLDITFPNILDRYVLREFAKILGLVVVSVMALFIIIDYTEIARDIRENNIAFHTIFTYYRFYIFQVLNLTLPISVLVATLVTFGILSKNNEVTALKSGGVSLYRVALPIVAIAGVISVLSYFVLDFVLPYSNQRVATIKRKIEGKRPISAGAQKLWFYGKGRYLINFLSYDRNQQELSQVQVFEFHPTEFRLTRRVYAQRAKWNGRAWVFDDGWIRSFLENGTYTYAPITSPLALYYPETPEDFETEVRAPDQMTFAQLHRYIDTIRKSGYGAEDLAVKLYTKTSWPAISLVMALIALPFAFKIGRRGALYGVGIALVLGIVYWMIFAIFTKFGEVGNLPAILSAWSANILFAIAA
ncbi:MAG TPA: LPS export ABC transporter permease LptG, partial [Thermoanaerobaculia bacterium]|nr:LPS export ABC transporter permease LptG [Thermoanaerobaculia bacterium]